MGFTAKWCIHPAQVKPIHDAFTPRDSDVELARRIVSAFDDAITAGLGAAMMGGQLIELPIVERARQTIRVSEKIAARVAERRPAET
jgi:citrate lyase beta subunit